jgi:hypothetical protein
MTFEHTPGFEDDEPPEQAETAQPNAGQSWPEPIDILADGRLTGLVSVDETCLPRSILAFAVAEGARLQVDPCGIAAHAIGTASGLLSDDWRVRLKSKDQAWIERPCVWVCMVVESGRKKSDQFRTATRPIAKIEARLREAYEKDKAEHLKQFNTWQATSKDQRGPEPEPPVEKRLVTDDYTVESLRDLLPSAGKVIIRADELATMLGAFERYHTGAINANRAHMLALYDGGTRRIDRKGSGHIYIPNWSAVVIGNIQPERVRAFVRDLSSDGLLQRFMIVMPGPITIEDPDADDVATDWKTIDSFVAVLERLHQLRPPVTQGRDGKPENVIVQAEPAVHAIRRRLFRLVERIEVDPFLPAPLKEAASKWRGLLARVSLVFHCLELAEQAVMGKPLQPADMDTLKAEAVEKACRFITRIVVPSTIRFHEEIGSVDMSTVHARWIAGHILSRGLERISARDVGRAYRELRGKKDEIEGVMRLLEHAGWVMPDNPFKPQKWQVNPAVHKAFADQAEEERRRRETVRQQIARPIAELLG